MSPPDEHVPLPSNTARISSRVLFAIAMLSAVNVIAEIVHLIQGK